MGAWDITCKDLRLLMRDRRALVMLLALPLIFITILGFSTGQMAGWRESNQVLQIALLNEDGGPLAQQVAHSLSRRDGLQITRVESREQAQDLMNRRDVNAAIYIGPNFHEQVEELTLGDILDPTNGVLKQGLSKLDMEVVHTPTFLTSGSLVADLVFADTLKTLVPHVAGKNALARRYMDRARSRRIELENAEPEREKPTRSESLPLPEQQRGSLVYQQLVPAYTVLFMFFLVNIMSRSFLAERDLGTLRRLQIAPITRTAMLTGKTVPFLILSLVQSSLLFLAGRLLYGMSWGPEPWLLIPVIASTSLAATTLGLLTATLVKSESQVSAYANTLVITMAGISGCFMPRRWLPEAMQQLSLGTPHAWSLIAFDELLAREVVAPTIVYRSCGMLLLFALGFFILGWCRFRAWEE